MPEDVVGLRPGEPENSLIDKMAVAENFALAAVTVIAAFNLVRWIIPALGDIFGRGSRAMTSGEVVAVLLLTASFLCSQPRFRKGVRLTGFAISALVAAWSAGELLSMMVHAGDQVLLQQSSAMAIITPQAAVSCVLVGIGALLVGVRGRLTGLAADFLTFCMAFSVAVLASGHLIGTLAFFGPVSNFITSGQTLLCASFLAAVVFIRRALQGGVFAILMGRGIGSKIARVLSPFLLILPYFREGLRAHLFSLRRMPPHYTTAIMATGIVAITMSMLMYLAWRLNALETEIQGLSLRDPLTGLNNLRGFRLLAEQSLLMAYRSGQPFSVLYVDVDNLKQINDALGHQTGSDFLTDTAELLREVFRETDVLGRIGGDEFAVAGQFSRAGIGDAARRLRQAAAERNLSAARSVGLSFSLGWVTAGAEKREPLAKLLARADDEMYKEKRRRKTSRIGVPELPLAPGPALLSPRGGSEAGRLREYGNS